MSQCFAVILKNFAGGCVWNGTPDFSENPSFTPKSSWKPARFF